MEKIKQNKNTSIILKVSSIFLSLIVLSCSITIPALANNTYYEVPNNSSVSNAEDKFNASLVVGTLNSGNTTYSYGVINTETNPVITYVFHVGNYIYVCSESNTQHIDVVYESNSNNNKSYSRLSGLVTTSTNYYSSTGLYYSHFNTSVNLNWEITGYDSVEAGLTDISNNIGGSAQQITYQIPAGYVAFFDIHGLSNIQGSVLASSGIPLTPSEWASTNILYGYSSIIPSSFSLPLTGSTSFSWRTGKTNIFGKSQSWSWIGTFAGGSNYLFVSNPTYSNVMGVQSNGTSMILDNPSATNSYVTVYLSEAYSVKLVSLNALITYDPSNGNYGGVDDGSGDSSYSVEYDPDTGTWVTTNDQTGNAVGVDGIPVGGDNSIDIPSEFSTITAWLENIANTIGAFFRGAIGAVSTLVSSGAAFINQLVSLYSWLPAPVYAVLSSALILVITIGVIKVFI